MRPYFSTKYAGGDQTPPFSFAKKYFFVLLFILYFLSLTLTQIITTDTWWNLSDGRFFFETWEVPTVDLYSYVTGGRPWVDGFWFSGVLLYPIFKLGGGFLLVITQVIVIALVFLLLSRIRKRYTPGLIFPSLVFTMLMASPRFQVRAELFALLSQAIFFYLMYKYQCGEESVRMGKKTFPLTAAFVLTMIFWANVHPSFVMGIFILSIFLMGELASGFLVRLGISNPEPRPVSGRQYFKLVGIYVATIAATVINPYGIKIWSVPFFFWKNHDFVAKNINEWMPLDLYWLRFVDRPFAAVLFLILVLGILGILANWRKTSISWAALWICSIFMFDASVRHISFYAMVSQPVLVLNWSELAVGHEQKRWIRQWGAIAIAVFMMIVVFDRVTERSIVQHAKYEAFGADFYRRTIPEAAVRFARENKLPGRIFNSYDLGSYIMYHWPEQKVFIDTRLHFRGTEDFQNYIDLMREPEKHWDDLAEQYRIQTVILKHLSRDTDFLVGYLFKHRDWTVMYCDERGIIFLKRAAGNLELINKFAPLLDLEGLFDRAERTYRPHWFKRMLGAGEVGSKKYETGSEKYELRRDTKNEEESAKRNFVNFSSRFPFLLLHTSYFTPHLFPREIPLELYWVARLYFDLGMYVEAGRAFSHLLNYVPDLADSYYFLGKISAEHQDFKQAMAFFEKSLFYNPGFSSAKKELVLSRTLANLKVVHLGDGNIPRDIAESPR